MTYTTAISRTKGVPWGGVALGETLGQMLTAGFLGAMAVVAMRDGARVRAGLALLAAALIAVGAQEGAAKMILGDPGPLPLVAVAGYLGLSLWLVAEGGARLLRR